MSGALSAGTVSLGVKPDTTGFGSKLAAGIDGESSGIGAIGAKLGGALMAGLGAVGIAVGVGEFIKKGVEEYSSADALNAQFAAGISSTNNAAGLTVKGMDSLAESIAGYSGQAVDSIGKTEQVLQTFTNIRNVGPDKIFDDATTAAANMAAKLGGDASSSAIQLGKALNDPVKGVAALTRVGVTFTDSQKASIAAMVAAGNTAGAQKVILAELTTEFGGAAKAAGETLPGEINRSKVAFGELSKAVVSGIMPFVVPAIAGIATAMEKVTPFVEAFADSFSSKLAPILHSVGGVIGSVVGQIATTLGPVIQEIGHEFSELMPTIGPLIPQILSLASSFSPISIIFHALLPVLPQLVGLVGTLAAMLAGQLAGVMKVLLPIISSIVKVLTGDLTSVFKELMPIIADLATTLGAVLGIAMADLVPVVVMLAQFIGKVFTAIEPLIPTVLKLVVALLPLIAPLLDLIGPILTPLIKLFTELLTPILGLAMTLIQILMPIVTVLVQALAAILPPVLKALMPIIQAMGEIFRDVLTPAIAGITQELNGLIDFLTGVFTGNWNKVWQGIGEIFSGMWTGLTGIAVGVINGVIDAINGIIKGIDSVKVAGVGLNIGTIAHVASLAQGATVLPTPGGTIVRVAEAGKPESVVDTGKLNGLIDSANASKTQGAFPDTVTLVDADGSIMARTQVVARQQSQAQLNQSLRNA